MDLDNLDRMAEIDPGNMLAQIDLLPEQLEKAWELGQRLPLPEWDGIEQVLIAGMGGSAIGADLLQAFISPLTRAPVLVHRNYSLPAWARGERTLVIASSHSGDTAETLTSFQTAREHGCRILTVSTGGKLTRAAREAGVTSWEYTHQGQPRAAVGFSFGLLLAAFSRLGLVPDQAEHLHQAVEAMRLQQRSLQASVPVVNNPAKRMAGQLYGRWTIVIAADALEPVARRWKGQLNELAKSWAQFDAIPEADHNTLAGVANPEEALARAMVLFLRAPSYHLGNQLRTELTKKTLMLEGLNTDFVDAQGDGPLAHQWTALHFGDYTAYYLAIAYGVDPTPIDAIQSFKAEMLSAED
jgi:glucose/mannose-6-phosphate isomerase